MSAEKNVNKLRIENSKLKDQIRIMDADMEKMENQIKESILQIEKLKQNDVISKKKNENHVTDLKEQLLLQKDVERKKETDFKKIERTLQDENKSLQNENKILQDELDACRKQEKSPSPKKRNSQMSANKRTELELELDAAQSRISEAQSLILELKEANKSLLVENQSLRDDLEVLSQPNIKKMSTTTSAQGEALGLDFFKSAPKTSAPKTGGPKTSPAAAHAQVENVKNTNVTMLKGRRFPEKGWKHNLHEMVTNFFKPEDYCSRHNNEESRCEDKKPDCVFVSSTEPLNKGDPNKCYDLTTYNFLKHRNVEEQYAASIKEFKKKGGNHKKSHTLKNKRLRPRSLRRHNTRKKSRA